MEFSIYSDDVRDFDDAVDRKFDIRSEYGSTIFDDRGKLSVENFEYTVEPQTYLAVMIDLQEQVDNLRKDVKQLKKIVGWTCGYDDNGWDVDKSLSKRVKSLEEQVEVSSE